METIKILIVEDELLAVSRLEMLISENLAEGEIVGKARSIEEAVSIISSTNIDLGFFDIEIEDGLSLKIFEICKINFPVIFTTAYNDYAVKAFKFNSIDYLLKPISSEELANAVQKFKTVWQKKDSNISDSIIEEMKQLVSGNYKGRFTVKIGNKIEVLNTSDVCFFYSYNKGTYAKSVKNRDLLLDTTLDLTIPVLDPKHFFRISRKYIVNINFIKDIYAYSNSRLRVNIENQGNEELIVSREKVKAFKNWLENSN